MMYTVYNEPRITVLMICRAHRSGRCVVTNKNYLIGIPW